MRFCLVDRIERIEPGQHITALKLLTLSEEYLADHFPRFPVMPGVFMLEALTQAGAWLVRVTQEFSHSLVTLKEARGVKYAEFVEPGSQLRLDLELIKQHEGLFTLKASGTVDGKPAVSGRLILQTANLADHDPQLTVVDTRLRREFLDQFKRLRPPVRRDLAAEVAVPKSLNGFQKEALAPLTP